MEQCSETSAYKIQTPGNYPEENIQHTEHGESFKLRNVMLLADCIRFPFFDWKILLLIKTYFTGITVA
jgi:hypothetical protein